MNGPLAALGLFTVLPAPVLDNLDRRTAGRALLALPWIGLLVGVIAGAAAWGVLAIGDGPLLAATVALALLALVTGGLHLDGLADTADGLGSRRPPAEALALMKRSDVGPLGVATLVLVLLVDVAALTARPTVLPLALAAGPLVARVGAVISSRGPSARPSGFGALFARVLAPAAVFATAIAGIVVPATLGWIAASGRGAVTFGISAGIATGVGYVWQRHCSRRLGGHTGDTYGSVIEVTQAAFWLACALAG